MRFSLPCWFLIFAPVSWGCCLVPPQMTFRKGSGRHHDAGNVFVMSMFSLSTSGAYLGFVKHQMLNGLMGVLTFYLMATAWVTAKGRQGEMGVFDLVLFWFRWRSEPDS